VKKGVDGKKPAQQRHGKPRLTDRKSNHDAQIADSLLS
jgi:hypothetical protein